MNEKYIILEHNEHLDSWRPKRWIFSNEIVTYDNFYEALHDCSKGEKIVKLSQYKESV